MKLKNELNPSELGEIVWLIKSGWQNGAIAKKVGTSVSVVNQMREKLTKNV